jgi:hypothetical protein
MGKSLKSSNDGYKSSKMKSTSKQKSIQYKKKKEKIKERDLDK